MFGDYYLFDFSLSLQINSSEIDSYVLDDYEYSYFLCTSINGILSNYKILSCMIFLIKMKKYFKQIFD